MKLSDVWPDAMDRQGAEVEGPAKLMVAELTDGQSVTSYFVCVDRDVRTTKNGGKMMSLTLSDATGQVKAIHFDPSDDVLADVTPGTVVKVKGMYRVDPRYGAQVVIERLRVMEEGDYDHIALVPVSPIPAGELERRLAALLAGVTEPHLRALLERAFDPAREPGRTFAVGPAAIRNHHAYRHGLLEHSLVVAEVAAGVADNLPSVDRDLVVAGALLHDIGKIATYSTDPFAPGFTDAGRLQGEIVLGHDLVRALIDEMNGFPEELSLCLRHIIVSHHGEREKGSPVVPMTREAVIVHYCDDMTARVAAVDDAELATVAGDRWSSYSRMLETVLFLGDRRTDGASTATGTGGSPAGSPDEAGEPGVEGAADDEAPDVARDPEAAPAVDAEVAGPGMLFGD
jgi:3'-5' exoribonuclease